MKKKAKPKPMKKQQKLQKPQPKVSKPQQKSSSSTIEFCEKCGSILVPLKKGKDTYLRCRGCGRQTKKDVKGLKIIEEKTREKGVLVIEKDTTLLPLTDKVCPKCEHNKAYWWMQQTRSADEPPTQFFRCEKCKHTWREYK
jgi:DNA-directed RNA polymerase subunit M